jgi:hypothetical protein
MAGATSASAMQPVIRILRKKTSRIFAATLELLPRGG